MNNSKGSELGAWILIIILSIALWFNIDGCNKKIMEQQRQRQINDSKG